MTTSAHALAQLHEPEAEREETERERDVNEIHHRESSDWLPARTLFIAA
jgi:hypothetical protein